MAAEATIKRPLLKYFILTYIIFLVLFGITGAMLALNLPSIIPDVLQVICAWSPTFALLILFKKIIPDQTLGAFIKRQFSSKVALGQLALAIGIQVLVFIGMVVLVSVSNNIPLLSAINTSASVLVLGFFNMLIRGPLGEEIGWRGYALNHLQKKHSPLVASIIIGLVWGFWHTPLWIVTSGYTGVQLIEYAALFLVGIICTSVIMTYFYNRSRNLLIPIVIHQLLNYSGFLVNADGMQTMFYQALLCLVAAIVLVIVNPKQFIDKNISSVQSELGIRQQREA